MFYIYVTIEVFHNDREIEFFAFRDSIELAIEEIFGFSEKLGLYGNIEGTSCEDINAIIAKSLAQRYPGRDFKIETYEDDENGAVLEYESAVKNLSASARKI
jgi:hypothetical protein